MRPVPRFVRFALQLSLLPVVAVLLPPSLPAEEAGKSDTKEAPATAGLLFIDNGKLKVGVKKEWGAGVAWLSTSGSDRNVINYFDHGRLVQQSYYGEADGSLWNGTPWKWNPVQGGDWKGHAAKVVKLEHGKDWLESVSVPKHWASGADIEEMRFRQRIEIVDEVVKIRFAMSYTGEKSHPVEGHEIPAVFIAPELDTLVYAAEGKPWADGPLVSRQPGWPNEFAMPVEPWAAYTGADGLGVGVCVPVMEKFTCYRFAAGTGSPAACSYVAPLTTFAITPGKTFSYDCYLTLGRVEEIRARFKSLCAKEK